MDLEQPDDVSNSNGEDSAANSSNNPGSDNGDLKIENSGPTTSHNANMHKDMTTNKELNQIESLESSEQEINNVQLNDNKVNIEINASVNKKEEKREESKNNLDDDERALGDTDSDLELVYENDEETELTDDALKLLDEELGITDDKLVENVKNNQEIEQDGTGELNKKENKDISDYKEINISEHEAVVHETGKENENDQANEMMTTCKNDLKVDETEKDLNICNTKEPDTEQSEHIKKDIDTKELVKVFETEINDSQNMEDKNELLISNTLENNFENSKNMLDTDGTEGKSDKNDVDSEVGDKKIDSSEKESQEDNQPLKVYEQQSFEPVDLIDQGDWGDNEPSVQLTDDALRKLDEELGISEEVNNIVSTEMISYSTESATPSMEIIEPSIENTTTPIEITSSNEEIITSQDIITSSTKVTPNTQTTPAEIIESSKETPMKIIDECKTSGKNIEMVEVANQIETIQDVVPIICKDTSDDIEMTEMKESVSQQNEVKNNSKDQAHKDILEPIEGTPLAGKLQDTTLMDVDITESNQMGEKEKLEGIQDNTAKNNPKQEIVKNNDLEEKTDKNIETQEEIDKRTEVGNVKKEIDKNIEVKEENVAFKKDTTKNIPAKENTPPKIRVLNVSEINHDNIIKESQDDIACHDKDGSLNITVNSNKIVIDCTNTAEKSVIETTSKEDSIGIKTDHKINRPDVMIDIPTQELIDVDDDDITCVDRVDSDSLTDKTVTEIVNQLEIEGPGKVDTNNKILKEAPLNETEINKTKDLNTDKVEQKTDTKESEESDETQDNMDLLAESSRIPDDDEEHEPEQDDDDADGDADDDDEIDHDDESSNQMTTAEHSEDSTDPPQEETQETNVVIDDSVDVSDKNGSDGNDVEEILNKEGKGISGYATTREKRRSVLFDLLTNMGNEEGQESRKSGNVENELTKAKDLNVVDIDESDSEEDKKEAKKDQENLSTADIKDTDEKQSKDDSKRADQNANEKVGANIDEVLNLDSDEEITTDVKATKNNKCLNNNCTSDPTVQYSRADRACKAYFNVRRTANVCQCCLDNFNARNQELLTGLKNMRPIIELEMSTPPQQLVEISDSESDDEEDPGDVIGDHTASLIEDQLDDLFNSSWVKYKMDDRLKDTEDYFRQELDKMERECKEVEDLMKNCEKMTDKLRNDLYKEFEPKKHELTALFIHDTPIASYICKEKDEKLNEAPRYPKRQASNTIDSTAKKQARESHGDQSKMDDDRDVSVVQLSPEAAPLDLPPPGEVTRLPLVAGMRVYAMRNSFGAWLPGKLLDVMGKINGFTQCKIKFINNVRNPCKVLAARCIAYTEPSNVRLTIGTRVVALFKNTEVSEPRKDAYYSGVVAEVPNPVNSYRYLVFFDDGYAQYVSHQHTLLVAESSDQVWEEVHPFSRDFVYNYLLKYPERPMVRMHQGQTISVELNGKWYDTRIVKVDASLVQVLFLEENRTEWIYRGSTRLRPLFVEFQAAKGSSRSRLPRTAANTKSNNVPYVEYTRSDEQTNKQAPQPTAPTEEQRRLRAVAKKSTGPAPVAPAAPSDGVTSRVVYYTPKHAVRPHKLVPHSCGPKCRRTDVLTLKELRTYNPLAKPLLSGWERQIVRYKGSRAVSYRGPCGRRLRNMSELHRYLSAIRSELSVDLFDFNPNTHCLAEFVLTKYNVGKKDLSHGKENVPVACVNYYDTSLPEFCSYNTERTPTAGVPLNLDPAFLCGCDCIDDCADKSKCACWQMTLEGAKTIGMEGPNIGYQYRRLLEPLPTGIYECNSRCKCKNTCLNRVAQHPLQLKLQVFKTINRGWGIRALNDVPKGAFLCIYAGNLLTDATANMDGLNEGDEYLAELDYIEVVESMKEGYEEDVVDPDEKTDQKDESTESEDEFEQDKSDDEKMNDKADDDFRPGHIGLGLTEFSKRLRKRDKKEKDATDDEKKEDSQSKKEGDDCITISDDEEVREPARFTAQEGMKDKKIVPKYKSIRDYFGEDEACYIMDAKVQGNIGRYLNHSCSPNVFVQNVFVDTHDPRFPWVSFFALHHIRAGTELTWNYNYDVGSVPGKVLYCFCGAGNCRGRLL